MTRRARLLAAWRGDRERLLLLAAALLLALAFLEPPLPWRRSLYEHLVVLDITQSMNVEDQPLGERTLPRLAAARLALREALEALPCGSRLGLAVFTEHRSYLLFTPVEVCANRAELRASLAAIDGRMAWSGNSEVAKGLHGALTIARALPGKPSIVFMTDGHEAPPLNPRHRPSFDDKPGEVPGLLVGVGGTVPAPIPKFDPLGRPLGTWGADEVMQHDPRSQGRGASVEGEALVEAGGPPPIAAAALGATPGSEHLSSLREPYLKLLAADNGLAYHRLSDGRALAAALRDPAFARQVTTHGDGEHLLEVAALALLAAHYMAALARRFRGGATGPARSAPGARPAGGPAASGTGAAPRRSAGR